MSVEAKEQQFSYVLIQYETDFVFLLVYLISYINTKVSFENVPDRPLIGKITHRSIEVIWIHVKEKLPENQRYKFILQDFDKAKKDWINVYSGYATSRVIEPLDSNSEHKFRLRTINANNECSEFSLPCDAKTTKEPISGDQLHREINLDRRMDVENILNSSGGLRIIEIPDKYGLTPLMSAIIRNNYEIFELLLARGANVNSQIESGKTALMLAAFYGKLNMIKELMRYNALLDLKDNAGCTVLHYAIDGGSLDTIQYFLSHGADVNAQDYSGWTPLLRAASTQCGKEIADLLIKYQADVNVLDKDNKSALLIAVVTGNQPLVQSLVENGADLQVKNNFGKTPLELAISMDKKRVVKFLEEYISQNGKDNLTNSSNKTDIDIKTDMKVNVEANKERLNYLDYLLRTNDKSHHTETHYPHNNHHEKHQHKDNHHRNENHHHYQHSHTHQQHHPHRMNHTHNQNHEGNLKQEHKNQVHQPHFLETHFQDNPQHHQTKHKNNQNEHHMGQHKH